MRAAMLFVTTTIRVDNNNDVSMKANANVRTIIILNGIWNESEKQVRT